MRSLSFRRIVAISLAVLVVSASLAAIPLATAKPPQHSKAPASEPPAPTAAPSTTTARAPIRIASDAEFTAANGVVQGDGSPTAPYVIRGWAITSFSGPAIEIKNVRAAFVVEGNFLELKGQGTVAAVALLDAGSRGVVLNNTVLTDGQGILAHLTNASVEGNRMWDTSTSIRSGRGLVLSHATVTAQQNMLIRFDTAASVTGGTPRLLENHVQGSAEGFALSTTTAPQVSGNVFLQFSGTALVLDAAASALVSGNLFQSVHTGLVTRGGSATVANNTFWGNSYMAASVDGASSLSARDNLFMGGHTGLTIARSTALVHNNSFSSAASTALTFVSASGEATQNRFDRNGGGIALMSSLIVASGNVMANNTWGFSIPFDSRQSIPLLSGNVVNGINVDGTLVPAQRVFHWRAANILMDGQVRDNGFSAGHYGAVAREGSVVLYEVDTALITRSTLAHGIRGVYAVHSFNVSVSESFLVDNTCGVVLEETSGAVKDTNITLIIDPPQTCGIDVRGGFTLVLRNEISNVDVGVRFDARAEGHIRLNRLWHVHTGITLTGGANQAGDAVFVQNNTLLHGRVGLAVHAFTGTASGNLIAYHTRAGVTLAATSRLTLVQNTVAFNADGVVDLYPCVGRGGSCSTVTLTGNVIMGNAGDGVRIQGGATLRGNTVTGNGGNGVVLSGAVTLVADNRFTFNARSGAVIASTAALSMRGNLYLENDEDGLVFTGTATVRGDVYLNHTNGAGIRFRGLLMDALQITVRGNLDGIVVAEPLPALPTVTIPTITVPGQQQPERDPLYVHLSVIEGNLRYALVTTTQTEVNATYNFWGQATGPRVSIAGQVGAFNNAVSPTVRFAPWYTDRQMTTVGPVPYL